MGIRRKSYTKDGKRFITKAWYLPIKRNGKVKWHPLGTADKKLAERAANKLRERLYKGEKGLEDYRETLAVNPETLVEQFIDRLVKQGRAKKHYSIVRGRLLAIMKHVSSIGEFNPQKIDSILDEIQADKDLGGLTRNRYRKALRAFFGWLIKQQRWDKNPVEQTDAVAEDESALKRSLHKEILRLLHDPRIPFYRRAVYRLAVTTGLRRKEMKSLRWSNIDFENGVVKLSASWTKNKTRDWLPLPPPTAQALSFLKPKDAKPTDLVFEVFPRTETFFRDIDLVEIPREENGEVTKFHSLRVTFASMLALKGEHVAVVQDLMRHSNINLTMNIYTRLGLDPRRDAVMRLDLPLAPDEMEKLASLLASQKALSLDNEGSKGTQEGVASSAKNAESTAVTFGSDNDLLL